MNPLTSNLEHHFPIIHRFASLNKEHFKKVYSDPVFTLFAIFQNEGKDPIHARRVVAILDRIPPESNLCDVTLQQRMVNFVKNLSGTRAHYSKIRKLFLSNLKSDPRIQTLFFKNKRVYRLLINAEFLFNKDIGKSNFFLPSLDQSLKSDPAIRDLMYLALHANSQCHVHFSGDLMIDVQQKVKTFVKIYEKDDTENFTVFTSPLNSDRSFIFFAIRMLTRVHPIAGQKADRLNRFIQKIEPSLFMSPQFWIDLIRTNQRLEPLCFAPENIKKDPSVFEVAVEYGDALQYADPSLKVNGIFLGKCIEKTMHIDNFKTLDCSVLQLPQVGKPLIPYLEKLLSSDSPHLPYIEQILYLLKGSFFEGAPTYEGRYRSLIVKFVKIQFVKAPHTILDFLEQLDPSLRRDGLLIVQLLQINVQWAEVFCEYFLCFNPDEEGVNQQSVDAFCETVYFLINNHPDYLYQVPQVFTRKIVLENTPEPILKNFNFIVGILSHFTYSGAHEGLAQLKLNYERLLNQAVRINPLLSYPKNLSVSTNESQTVEKDFRFKTEFLLNCYAHPAIGAFFKSTLPTPIANLQAIREKSYSLSSLFLAVELRKDRGYLLTLFQILKYPTIILREGEKELASDQDYLDALFEIVKKWAKENRRSDLPEIIQSLLNWSQSPSFNEKIEKLVEEQEKKSGN